MISCFRHPRNGAKTEQSDIEETKRGKTILESRYYKPPLTNVFVVTPPCVDINMNQTKMEGAVEKMQLYVELAEKEISRRKMESQSLRDELKRSQQLMQSIQEKLRQAEEYVVRQQSVTRISQFKMHKIVSGGTINVCMSIAEPSQCEVTHRIGCQRKGCCMLERLYLSGGGYEEVQKECQWDRLQPSVIALKRTGQQDMYSVKLLACDPCPSPDSSETSGTHVVVEPSQTVCDIWSSWTDHEQTYKKRQRRIAQKRRTRIKSSVKEAFGINSIAEDSTLFRVVCGFMEGSQECYDGSANYVVDYIKRLDDTKDNEVTAQRATKAGRKVLLMQIVSLMYNGEVATQLEANVLRKKRFSTVKLARVSDMNCSFNPRALGAIASCEGGKAKGEVGLLLSLIHI